MKKCSAARGFTLIELLIVVAIIAILAAIAVPNFLEAQTRAKVSRFMADVRSAGVAIESYAVDHNKYPTPDAVPAGSDLSIAGPFWPVTAGDPQENYLPRSLTTPISYITSLPGDIFAHGGDGFPVAHTFHYVNDQFNSGWSARPWAGDLEREFYVARALASLRLGIPNPAPNQFITGALWLMHSHGPDLDHDDYLSDAGMPLDYDPTNGTLSDGDVFYFGPGIGFTR